MTRRAVYGRADVALPTPAEAAALDQAARERSGIPERVLMENAGRSAALLLDALYPNGRVVGVVGAGHNGGDALVVLRNLRAWGRDVAFIRASARLPEPAPLHDFDVPELPAAAAELALAGAGVLLDGILGTGTSGAPREPAASLIRAMNASGRPIVALDLPSGVDAAGGAVPGEAIAAAVTVTFGWPKLGLMLHPARQRCGRLIAVEIGFPPWETGGAGAELITPDWAAVRLPARPPTAHKRVAGRVLVVAGRSGMAGAAVLAAEAAVRAGAGLVYVASAPENRVIVQAEVPEAIFRDRAAQGDPDALSVAGIEAVLAGPGLAPRSPDDQEAYAVLARLFTARGATPLVLDAEALNQLATRLEVLRGLAADGPLVLTPHPGEMSRLTGLGIDDIRDRPVEVARSFAEDVGCVVLLKGQPSIVAAPGQPVLVNSTGSSDVAAGGMGDQLGGTIVALLAAGADARTGAALGLFYAGRAADLARRGRSLSPRNVSAELHAAYDRPGATSPPFGFPFITFDQPPPR